MQMAQGDAQVVGTASGTEVSRATTEGDAVEKQKHAWKLLESVPSSEVRCVAFRYTRNLPLADLVVTETYLRGFEAMDTYKGGDNPRSIRAFLFITARNIAFEWRRREKIAPVEYVSNPCEFDAPLVVDELSNPIISDMDHALINDIFTALTPRRLEILLLSLVDEVPTDEIANRLKIKPSTVRKTLSVARKQLQQLLAQRGILP